METAPNRLAYLDNLRSFVIFLVVVMHSNVTYSGMGSWYYTEGDPGRLDLVSKVLFGLYGSFTQAWFMGALFFLAAFFAARSLKTKGTRAFVRDRCFRLGAPLALFVFVIQPLTVAFLYDGGRIARTVGLAAFGADYLGSGAFLGGTGPLWFVETLLVLSLAYALVRRFFPARGGAVVPPGPWVWAGLIGGMAVLAFALRLVWPLGTAVANLQFGFFASYLVLFAAGLHAGERDWLEAMAAGPGRVWLRAGLGLGLPAWGLLMVAGGALTGDIPISGGLHWQTAAYALWESFTAVALTLGMPALFRRWGNAGTPAARFLARHSFRVYLFHAPVLIALSLLLASAAWPPLAKHLLVAPLAWGLTLAFSALLVARIPGLREISR